MFGGRLALSRHPPPFLSAPPFRETYCSGGSDRQYRHPATLAVPTSGCALRRVTLRRLKTRPEGPCPLRGHWRAQHAHGVTDQSRACQREGRTKSIGNYNKDQDLERPKWKRTIP